MRAFVLSLCLLTTPAGAAEAIFNSPNGAGFVALAKLFGYYDNTLSKLRVAGPLTGKYANYFLNPVGVFTYPDPVLTTTDAFGNTVPVIDTAPGYWVRLRHNGPLSDLPGGSVAAVVSTANANGVTIYIWRQALDSGNGCWSSDNLTCAPAYVANVGLIE